MQNLLPFGLLADVNPDNIFVNWTCDNEGNKTVTDIALGDFGIAYKQVGATPLRTGVALGNFMCGAQKDRLEVV